MAKVTGRSSDQFNLRLPDGMREEIKWMAEEDGQSMNTKIIELLQFALLNSGLDIDALLRGLSDQHAEISRLRRLVGRDQDLATSVLWHVLTYIDDIPPSLAIWADNLLKILESDDPRPSELDNKFAERNSEKNKKEVQSRLLEAKERQKEHMDTTIARIMGDRGADIEKIREGFKSK